MINLLSSTPAKTTQNTALKFGDSETMRLLNSNTSPSMLSHRNVLPSLGFVNEGHVTLYPPETSMALVPLSGREVVPLILPMPSIVKQPVPSAPLEIMPPQSDKTPLPPKEFSADYKSKIGGFKPFSETTFLPPKNVNDAYKSKTEFMSFMANSETKQSSGKQINDENLSDQTLTAIRARLIALARLNNADLRALMQDCLRGCPINFV